MNQKRSDFKFLSKPSNRGRHIIWVAGKVFTAQNGKQAVKILTRIHRQFPRKKVTLTYIPDSDALILSA